MKPAPPSSEFLSVAPASPPDDPRDGEPSPSGLLPATHGVNAPESVEVAEVHDETRRRQMQALLDEGFPAAGFDWQLAFKAPPGRHGHGLLLMVDGVPQGALLAFEKFEPIGGKERRVINLSSWYVRPAYRRHVIHMVRDLLRDSEAIFTACTPIASVRAIARRLGFRVLSHGSIASIPLLNGVSTPPGIEVSEFSEDSAAVTPEIARWIKDHTGPGTGTIAHLIRWGERFAVALWRRGYAVAELPAARLLYASDHELLRAALPAIHRRMAFRLGIIALYLPRIAPFQSLHSVRRPGKGPSIIVKGDVTDENVNLLYSELHYLPVLRRPFRKRLPRILHGIRRRLSTLLPKKH